MATSNPSGALRKPIEDGETFEVDRDPEQMLDSIMEGVAESVLEASDEEILAEARERGCDPTQEANAVRQILLEALKRALPDETARSERALRSPADQGK
jgi:hypothetical protein